MSAARRRAPSRARLLTLIDKFRCQLVSELLVEHRDHIAGPEVGCPLCEEVQALAADLDQDWCQSFRGRGPLRLVPSGGAG